MNDFPCIEEQNATRNVSIATRKSGFATQLLAFCVHIKAQSKLLDETLRYITFILGFGRANFT